MVARAPADGYTLLLGSSSEIAQYPNVASNVPYDPQRDFTPIALLATVPLVLTVIERCRSRRVQELLDHARRNPGKLNYGSAGPGSGTHLAMALLTSMTGTTMTHVPYRGSAPAVADLIAGNLHLAIPTMSAVLPHAGGGKAQAAGGVDHQAGGGAAGAADHRGERRCRLRHRPVDRPAGARQHAARDRRAAQRRGRRGAGVARPEGILLLRQGAEQTGGTPEQFAEEIKRELALWRELVQQTGIRID